MEFPFCLCGCGSRVKYIKSKYCRGHGRRGKTLSNSHKQNISKSLKNLEFTKEHRTNISESATGRIFSLDTKSKLSILRMGKIPGNKGKHHSKESREKIAKFARDRKHTEHTKLKMRESAISQIEIRKCNGEPLTPCIGKYERECLNLLQSTFNIEIKRNYKICGYFVDGYISSLNLIIEFDEPWHKNCQERDKQRQNNIISYLHSRFFRIDQNQWLNDRNSIIKKFGVFINE